MTENRRIDELLMSQTVTIVRAYDHYSTDDPNAIRCVSEFVGVLISEDEVYLFLRHIKADINDPASAEEQHRVLKNAIIDRRDFPFSWRSEAKWQHMI